METIYEEVRRSTLAIKHNAHLSKRRINVEITDELWIDLFRDILEKRMNEGEALSKSDIIEEVKRFDPSLQVRMLDIVANVMGHGE